MVRATSRRICLVVAFFIAQGCSSDDTTSPEAVVGVYALQTINDQPLPYTYPGDPPGFRTTVTSGSLRFESNGTWRYGEQGTREDSSNGLYSEDASGTYTQHGLTLTLTQSGEGTYTASISGDRITLVLNPEANTLFLEYRRIPG